MQSDLPFEDSLCQMLQMLDKIEKIGAGYSNDAKHCLIANIRKVANGQCKVLKGNNAQLAAIITVSVLSYVWGHSE
jgi:hypothetical protein